MTNKSRSVGANYRVMHNFGDARGPRTTHGSLPAALRANCRSPRSTSRTLPTSPNTRASNSSVSDHSPWDDLWEDEPASATVVRVTQRHSYVQLRQLG